MSLNNMSLSLNNLYEKYKDQPEVLSKMEEYLNKQFPHALELFVTRINRKQNLEKQKNNAEIPRKSKRPFYFL